MSNENTLHFPDFIILPGATCSDGGKSSFATKFCINNRLTRKVHGGMLARIIMTKQTLHTDTNSLTIRTICLTNRTVAERWCTGKAFQFYDWNTGQA
jgi:hypothetical protein